MDRGDGCSGSEGTGAARADGTGRVDPRLRRTPVTDWSIGPVMCTRARRAAAQCRRAPQMPRLSRRIVLASRLPAGWLTAFADTDRPAGSEVTAVPVPRRHGRHRDREPDWCLLNGLTRVRGLSLS